MMSHPYKSQPDYAYWNRAVAKISPSSVDPVVSVPFTIDSDDKIATAGSCFAQHISRYLKNNGFNYYVVETAHPLVADRLTSVYNYGAFSARYGNVYTARQLLQLYQRAFGEFEPAEKAWWVNDTTWVDPLRPQIQPEGYRTLEELELDRAQHLSRVRQMFLELDVFVFTFGLTESWVSLADGTVYPVCPGVSGGDFDSHRHAFVNFGVEEVTQDFEVFLEKLRAVNPKAKIILTVSPVPLVATAENTHVLTATVYSKSVLRVAAENITSKYKDVAYFPSYEIITGNFSRGNYFSSDLRSITEEGVEHVMKLFLKHYTGCELETSQPIAGSSMDTSNTLFAEMQKLVEINCDEMALDPSLSK